MFYQNNNREKIGIVTKSLALYFVLMPFDSINIFGLGSLLKVIALFPIIAILIYGRQNKFTINRITGVLIIYTLVIAASYLYSIDFTMSQSAVIRLVLNMALIIFAGKIYDEYNNAEYQYLIKAMVVGGIFNIMLTLLFSTSGRLTLSVAGSTQDSNYINGYSLFALACFANMLFNEKKIWAVGPILIILVFTLSTGSRGALLASFSVLFAVLFYLYVIQHKITPSMFFVLIIFLSLIAIFSENILMLVAPEVLQRYSIEYIENYRGINRSDLWLNLLDVYKNSSFFRQLCGYGVSTVPHVEWLSHHVAHNLWIEHLIANGLVGLIALCLMQAIFLKSAVKAKDLVLISAYIGLLVMCMTLSLVSYKPIWNVMIMIMISKQIRRRELRMKQNQNIDENEINLNM